MDGARILNASLASGVPLAQILENVDSVSMCFSKVRLEDLHSVYILILCGSFQGVGAPVGSVIGGTKDFIYQ